MPPEERMLLERATEQVLLGPKRSPSREICRWLSPAYPRRCLYMLLASQPTKHSPARPGARGIDKAPSCSEPSKKTKEKNSVTWVLVPAIYIWACKSRLTGNSRPTSKRTFDQQNGSTPANAFLERPCM